MEYDIFISYSRKDSEIVNQFVQQLTDAGYSVWIDREGIYSGDQFEGKISEAIDSSTIILFFSSYDSNESEYVIDEICYALSEDKIIIPIKIDDCKYNKSFKMRLTRIDHILYQQKLFSSTIDRLISSVSAHLGKAPSTSSNAQTCNLPPEESLQLGKNKSESNQEENSGSISSKASKNDSQPATLSSTSSLPEMPPRGTSICWQKAL